MKTWRGRVVWLGLCLGAVGCGSSQPPAEEPESCETTNSCDDSRVGNPNPGTPDTPPDDTTPPPTGNPNPPTNGNPNPPPTPPPAVQTGETLWQQHSRGELHEYASSVATTTDGQYIYTATSRGSQSPRGDSAEGSRAEFKVRRYSAAGQVQWEETYPLYANERVPPEDVWGRIRLSVGPTGDLYVLTEVHEGVVAVTQGPFGGLVLTKISASREPKWSARLPDTDTFLAMTASRDDGVFVSVMTKYPYSEQLRCAPAQGAIWRFGADGQRMWRAPLGEPQCEGARAEAKSLAAQPGGGVALGGTFFGTLEVGAERFTTQRFSPFLGVISPAGTWSWVKAMPDVWGEITSVGSSAKGTVVAAGTAQEGALRWGNDTLGKVPSFLLVAEATGEPRWAKSMGRSEEPVVAVEPAGRVAVAGLSRDYPTAGPGSSDPTNNPQLFIRRYNLAGKALWNRYFSRSAGPSNLFSEQFMCAVPSGEGNGSTLLFGHFSHPENFGKGTVTPNLTDTILLKVGPGPEF